MDALPVEIWSDVACPWCWVGKRNLEAAIAEFGHPVRVSWRAFELDPTSPRKLDGPVDMLARLAKKYGASTEQAQAMIDRMDNVGAQVGIDFRFERMQPTNTFDAHRLLHWAHKQGRQNELKEELFVARMHEGQSVADHDVLVGAAQRAGLDPEKAQGVLSSNDYADAVRGDEAQAGKLGVTGVPFFVVGERYAIGGAQPKAVLLRALNKAWSDRTVSLDADADAQACGPEGCELPA